MFAYRKKSRSEALSEQIKELAKEHYRWGYRLLFNYLRRLGENVNHKKFLRIYRQEHLQIGKRTRRKERRFDRVKSGQPKQINERWSMDFMYDVLENKSSYRILNIIDDHTRECLCCEVSRSFGGYDVAETLDRLIDRYGKPKTIKSDNGAEFRSRYMEK
ncbi:MAG: DDE-type integrase/transposase/recombinase [Candidatus Merdousia sp.]|nr:DDE-type integrase/transposase/recombinase [Candidatus Merdousia sp.]